MMEFSNLQYISSFSVIVCPSPLPSPVNVNLTFLLSIDLPYDSKVNAEQISVLTEHQF